MSSSTGTLENRLSSPMGVVALVLLLVFGFALLPRLFSPRQQKLDEATAKAAGDFTLRVIANQDQLSPAADTVTLSKLQGKPVILDFWASWCGPCQMETPVVDKVYQRFKDRGLVVVGVNTGDAETAGRAWVQRHGITFPIAYDANDQAARTFGVDSLPTLILVSKSGKVLAVRTGITDDAELEGLVKQAL